MSVYKPCDIRGPERELSPELYQRWGEVLGGWLDPGYLFLVGGDVRLSTPSFREGLIQGLCQAGMQVADLGVLPTPMVYFGKRHLNAPGCAIVTASHSPPGINGLKWMVGDLPPSEEEVDQLRQETESGKRERRPGGRKEAREIGPEYQAWLRERWGNSRVEGRVVLDPGGGCWSGRAGAYLSEIFPRIECTALHDQADGQFRARHPDSARPEHLRALSAQVLREGADLGIAFDGDGDRVSFVDGQGCVLTAEESAWILIQSFGPAWKGRYFAYDIKCSDRIPEAVRSLGGEPVPLRSGHAFIRTAMIERSALFGAEISGHFFYGELEGGDDGLFTACRMLGFLEETGKSLAEWRQACPRIFMTPDLRLEVAPDQQDAILEQVKHTFREFPQVFVDGIRVEFESGWALVRKSVTAPELTFRFEGEGADQLDQIVRSFCARLPGVGDQLWQAYQEKAGER